LKWLGLQLAATGVTKREISRFLGVNVKTVDRWLRPELAEKQKEASRASHAKHKEKRKAGQKRWREKNKEHLKLKNKKYHEENKKQIKLASSRWRESNLAQLRENSRKFYSGEKIHSSLTAEDCLRIRSLYEAGVRTCDLCAQYGVGPKAIIGAIRHVGGSIKSKARSLGLSDNLSGFLDGLHCRDDRQKVILYLNSTAMPGAHKLGITSETWKKRASKNGCDGKIYASLIKTWELPSRFHGWCIEQCWAALRKPSSLGELAALNGHTELRVGCESELAEMVDAWVTSACLLPDGVESRRRAAMLVLASVKRRSAIYKKVEAALLSANWECRLFPPVKAKVSVLEG
jgi:hypothetical protein